MSNPKKKKVNTIYELTLTGISTVNNGLELDDQKEGESFLEMLMRHQLEMFVTAYNNRDAFNGLKSKSRLSLKIKE